MKAFSEVPAEAELRGDHIRIQKPIGSYTFQSDVSVAGFVLEITPVKKLHLGFTKPISIVYLLMDLGPMSGNKSPYDIGGKNRNLMRMVATGDKAKAIMAWANRRREAGEWPAWLSVTGKLELVRRKTGNLIIGSQRFARYEHNIEIGRWWDGRMEHKAVVKPRMDDPNRPSMLLD